MITVTNKLFSISTNSTIYVFSVNETGHLEHLYFGTKFKFAPGDFDAIKDKHNLKIGIGTSYSEDNQTLFLENLCMEYSTQGKGDYRQPMLAISYENGKRTLDFAYKGYEVFQGKPMMEDGGAQAYGSEDNCSTLRVDLVDKVLSIDVSLYYTTFDACDVILRKTVITNNTDDPIALRAVASLQLDLFDEKWNFTSFDGAWARERSKNTRPLCDGTLINESRNGVSSADHNPLVFLSRPDADEYHGEVIGCNLLYSGNHRESVEVNPYGKTRLITGINPDLFSWKLDKGATFTSPEAILTFSASGFNKASSNFHTFVNNHIIRGIWKYRERPVLINSWEASYFNFTEEKLLTLAKQASALGIELFVLDDGWFGSRDDDTTSLGDWYTNPHKLPSGLPAFSQRIHNLGMMFGLWVEPEMINMQSQLYLSHPDWTISIKGRTPSVGRHQYILDITRKEVQDYLFKTISEVFIQSDVNYVKWDMNRVFSDIDSANPEIKDIGEYPHRYVLALYSLLERFTTAFPKVLFEGCASGGNRFDLGMLCYFKQLWTSDNTDAYCRQAIQEGTSYGYPLSSMGCHVSICPNHQTLRNTSLETRFNVACFGDLGYELDITTLSREQKQVIANQITFFRQFRSTLQFGLFSRVRHDEITEWVCTSQDKNTMLVLWFQTFNPANAKKDILYVPEADEDAVYDVFPRQQRIPLSVFGNLVKQVSGVQEGNKNTQRIAAENVSVPGEIEHYTVSGGILKYAGIKLNQQFSGTGNDSETRILGDFGSRIYIIRKR